MTGGELTENLPRPWRALTWLRELVIGRKPNAWTVTSDARLARLEAEVARLEAEVERARRVSDQS